jgi:hypothetical protein
MHRPLAILLGIGLLGGTAGCNHTHGVCDCDLGPIGQNGPPPLAAPPPLRPVPAYPMPQPQTKLPTTSSIVPTENVTSGEESAPVPSTATDTPK